MALRSSFLEAVEVEVEPNKKNFRKARTGFAERRSRVASHRPEEIFT